MFLKGNYDLGDRLSAFAQANYANIEVTTNGGIPPAITVWQSPVPRDGRALPADLNALLDSRCARPPLPRRQPAQYPARSVFYYRFHDWPPGWHPPGRRTLEPLPGARLQRPDPAGEHQRRLADTGRSRRRVRGEHHLGGLSLEGPDGYRKRELQNAFAAALSVPRRSSRTSARAGRSSTTPPPR